MSATASLGLAALKAVVANIGTPLNPVMGQTFGNEQPDPAPKPAATEEAEPAAPAIDYGTWLLWIAIAAGVAWYFWPEKVEGLYGKVKGFIS